MSTEEIAKLIDRPVKDMEIIVLQLLIKWILKDTRKCIDLLLWDLTSYEK